MALINLYDEKGPPSWDKGLIEACSENHVHMAKWMILRGASTFSTGFVNAVEHGHMETALLMLEYRTMPVLYLNNALKVACLNKRDDFIRLALEQGATHCVNCGDNHSFTTKRKL
jgi:hypothetical protein